MPAAAAAHGLRRLPAEARPESHPCATALKKATFTDIEPLLDSEIATGRELLSALKTRL